MDTGISPGGWRGNGVMPLLIYSRSAGAAFVRTLPKFAANRENKPGSLLLPPNTHAQPTRFADSPREGWPRQRNHHRAEMQPLRAPSNHTESFDSKYIRFNDSWPLVVPPIWQGTSPTIAIPERAGHPLRSAGPAPITSGA